MMVPSGRSYVRHDPEPVVHRVTQTLLAAQIPLGGLDGDMAEQELNLFQFAAARQAWGAFRFRKNPHASRFFGNVANAGWATGPFIILRNLHKLLTSL
jgi:hypothetical protein